MPLPFLNFCVAAVVSFCFLPIFLLYYPAFEGQGGELPSYKSYMAELIP